MTDQELIAFGNGLIDKERTSTEIYNALLRKASSKEQLNRVLAKVVKPEAKKKKRSPELVTVLLKANRIKLRSDYAIASLIRFTMVVLAAGGIVLFLSKEEVNNNALFGWFTLAQGFILLLLYYFVKHQEKTELLLVGLIVYCSIWLLELLIDGIPNDLLDVYNQPGVNVRTSNINQEVNSGGARAIGFMFPYIYVGTKLLFAWFAANAYFNHKKYNALPENIKLELEDF